MTRPADPGTLRRHEWASFHRLAERMEEALEQNPSCDLAALLPSASFPQERLLALHELIKIELEFSWGRQRPITLEQYLQRFPELGTATTLPVALIYEEYRARHLHGDRPPLNSYRERFPNQFEELQQKLRSEGMFTLAETSTPLIEHLGSQPRTAPGEVLATWASSSATPADVPVTVDKPSAVPAPPVASPSRTPASGSLLLLSGEGYQLLERIGNGQFGEVYRALAPGGVVVAVKRIFRSLDDASSQRELKALDKIKELRHPFLLQTHNFQAFEDRLIIVMELADGSLQDRFKEYQAKGLPGIPAEELLDYFAEAGEALDFLREQKLAHLDIKPQNLLHLKGHAKVADFGVARTQEKALDHTLNVGGTPPYMPPEIWGGDVSVHSDQYSFAVTWYEMRTGKRVFSGKSLHDLAQQHLSKKPDVSNISKEEQQVLLRALAKDPSQRFPSCVAFVEALRQAVAPPKPVVSTQGWGAKVAVAALAVALASVLIALFVILWRPSPPPPPKQIWQPEGWEPVDPRAALVSDRRKQLYYPRLKRTLGGQTVIMVVIPQEEPNDLQTFYIMQTKVWNDLYKAFLQDPKSAELLRKYSTCQGCESLVKGEWQKGALAPEHADGRPELGVDGAQGRVPVFHVTATEGECLAEWMGGRLPKRDQYAKAACLKDLKPPEAVDGNPADLALNLSKEGPWSVDRWGRDENRFGCQQLLSNGKEFTSSLQDNLPNELGELPLERMKVRRRVYIMGKSYLDQEPPSLDKLLSPDSVFCTDSSYEISFRVVLEQ